MNPPQTVLAQYDLPTIDRTESLGSSGGFSGAQFWKIFSGQETSCLRRWPTSFSDQPRLKWIHLVLRHSFHDQCPFIAAPRLTNDGRSFLIHDRSMWEISPWMPGTANFEDDPNESRLENMIEALARFHQSSAQVSLDFRLSPNLQSRLDQLERLPQTIQQLQNSPAHSNAPIEVRGELAFLRQAVLRDGQAMGQQLSQSLRPLSAAVFPVQPIIRDIWHDHVLFTGNKVTGMVDFGAMQMDNIAFDMARLLGSTIADSTERWPLAMEMYSKTRLLSETETALIPLLDQSATLLGSLNWLKWICLEQKQFENWHAVKARLLFLKQRLNQLVAL